MNVPCVSVIFPVYNGAPYLKDAINSLPTAVVGGLAIYLYGVIGMHGIALMIAQGKIINMPVSVELLGGGKIGFFPISVLIFLITCVVVFVILSRLKFGRRLYAIGDNEEAAFYSGVRVKLYKFFAYGFGGLLVAVASVLLLNRLGSASAAMGKGYELQGIAAAVIGGVSLSGGKGSVIGAFLGVLLLGIISNAMNILGISPFSQDVILGSIIVTAVVLSNLAEKRK